MGRPAIMRCCPQPCGTQVHQHRLPIAGPTCSQASGAQRRALGPGSRTAPPAPRRSPARAVAGSAGGRGKGGAVQPRLPRGYLTAQQPRPRRPGAPRSAPCAPARQEQGQPLTQAALRRRRPAPGALEARRAPGARRARRARRGWGLGEETPGARGSSAPAARGCHTWRAPASHPFPLTPGCAPCPLPTSAARPKTPTFAPSYPIDPSPKSSPTCSHCRHPREGKRPDVRPVAKGNRRE